MEVRRNDIPWDELTEEQKQFERDHWENSRYTEDDVEPEEVKQMQRDLFKR